MHSGTEDHDIGLLCCSSSEDEPTNDPNSDKVSYMEDDNFQTTDLDRGGDLAMNPNAKTIEILQKMLSYYVRTGDMWHALSYRKAIAALRRQQVMIATAEQARSIPTIGFRLANKIEEIVTTSHLRCLDSALEERSNCALRLFMNIYGVGYKQARIWVTQGHRTLEDLRNKANLTDIQTIGLDHYDDFVQRIPRSEVERHGAIVQWTLARVDSQLKAIIGGSFRRGDNESGDIDVLITSTDDNATIEHIRDNVMTKVVPALTQIGFLKCALASSFRDSTNRAEKSKASKWQGASALPAGSHGSSPTWRRIDLLIAPPSELGAALLYFTGNDVFNRSMRLLASKKRMRLNQRGLYTDVAGGSEQARTTTGRLLEGKSEKKIFQILGVPWREPKDRDC